MYVYVCVWGRQHLFEHMYLCGVCVSVEEPGVSGRVSLNQTNKKQREQV